MRHSTRSSPGFATRSKEDAYEPTPYVETPAGVMRGNGRLTRLYTNRFSSAQRFAKERLWKTLCEHWFSRYISSEGTALDLGAGYWPWLVRLYLAFPPVQWLLGKQMLLVAERPG